MTAPAPAAIIVPVEALVAECRRLEETCSYTAVTFTIWLRWLKGVRTLLVAIPVIAGGLATWRIMVDSSPTWAAVFTLIATVMPLVHRTLKVDRAIEDYTRLAGEFTNLRDRFRQAALITSQQAGAVFQLEAGKLFDRLDKARRRTLTPPELVFRLARRKIKAGHMRHDYDETPKEDRP